MERIKLPTYPEKVPDHIEVRDYRLDSGRYARVRMTIAVRELANGERMVELSGQAFEMTAEGVPALSPIGEPSRCGSSSSSASASAFGKTVAIDDAWLPLPILFDPSEPGDVETVDAIPSAPGVRYGARVYVVPEARVYAWTEGFADTFARTKVADLETVIANSNPLSGFFRRSDATAGGSA
jgi:hypothetical protein